MAYSYDRSVTAMGPASRLKDAESNLKSSETAIERAKGILHGMVKEMEIVAKHTHDHTIQDNFKKVTDFSKRLDHLDGDMDKLLADLEHFSKTFR